MPVLPSISGSATPPHVPAAARPRVRRGDNGVQDAPVSGVASFHEDGYPWCTGRSASGVEWAMAADNIQLVS